MFYFISKLQLRGFGKELLAGAWTDMDFQVGAWKPEKIWVYINVLNGCEALRRHIGL
ncbi:MAG: hypothetical protein GY862_04720 [Gammaproteobacteria bacterium]|nr:hypothetical protein [Gammaproteobacteria bacterium]